MVANGYTKGAVEWAIQKSGTGRSRVPAEQKVENRRLVLPYNGTTSAKIGRLIRPFQYTQVFHPATKMTLMLRSVKDPLGLKVSGIYRIPSQCCKVAILTSLATPWKNVLKKTHIILDYSS